MRVRADSFWQTDRMWLERVPFVTPHTDEISTVVNPLAKQESSWASRPERTPGARAGVNGAGFMVIVSPSLNSTSQFH
jgi:hypothetical protein